MHPRWHKRQELSRTGWLATLMGLCLCTASFGEDLSTACLNQESAPNVSNARPSVVVVGSSTVYGYGATTLANAFIWRLADLLQKRKPGECLTNLGYPGFSTYATRSIGMPADAFSATLPVNPLYNIDRALELRPALVILHLPTNDAILDVPFESSRANMLDMLHRVDSAGAKALLIGALPRNMDATKTAALIKWKNFLDTLSTTDRVEIWSLLALDSGHLRAECDADGIHPNDSGHAILFHKMARTPSWQSFVPGNDTETTTLASVVSMALPTAGTYRKLSTLSFTATYSKPVSVVGTPAMALVLGSTRALAKYTGGTGTSALKFEYTIQASDLDTNGIVVSKWIDTTQGTISDLSSHRAATNLMGSEPTDQIKIDGRTSVGVQLVPHASRPELSWHNRRLLIKGLAGPEEVRFLNLSGHEVGKAMMVPNHEGNAEIQTALPDGIVVVQVRGLASQLFIQAQQ